MSIFKDRELESKERDDSMIVKYKSSGMWNYIDEVSHAKESGLYFPDFLISKYNEEVETGQRIDVSGEDWGEENKKINKCFLKASEMLDEKFTPCANTENLITEDCVTNGLPIGTVLIKLRGQDAFSKALITCQEVYLMNDKGQTIERLV
jgi:hypothetical protein